jgi:hypothetical protein
VASLRRHHETRLGAVRALVAGGAQPTGAEVARSLRWSSAPGAWDRAPAGLRWLLATETLAHLDHLATTREVRRVRRPDGATGHVLVP